MRYPENHKAQSERCQQQETRLLEEAGFLVRRFAAAPFRGILKSMQIFTPTLDMMEEAG